MASLSPRWRLWLSLSVWSSLAWGLVGCGGNSLAPPAISPSEVAAKAIEQYDKNGDGVLDATELEACPALKSALKQLDTNGDGKVSAEELAARLTKMQEANVSRVGVSVKVRLDGEPLEGARVRLVPEAFLGAGYQPAEGTTTPGGAASIRLQDAAVDGVPWGYYRIEVSKKVDGKELLPERYNSATTLGCEVAPDQRGGIVLKLSS